MKVKIQFMETVSIPTQEIVWAVFGNDLKPVTRQDCDFALSEKFGPLVKGIHFLWNFSHTQNLPPQMIVGIETANFDAVNVDKPNECLLEADHLDPEDKLRRQGALLSELERIGIFLIGNENPFVSQVFVKTEGN